VELEGVSRLGLDVHADDLEAGAGIANAATTSPTE